MGMFIGVMIILGIFVVAIVELNPICMLICFGVGIYSINSGEMPNYWVGWFIIVAMVLGIIWNLTKADRQRNGW